MSKLWSVSDIGEYLGYKRSTVYSRIICRPTFPQPVRLTGSPRWFSDEVEKWVRQQRPTQPQSH